MSQPVRPEKVIVTQNAGGRVPLTAGRIAFYTGGGVLALSALGGAAVAVAGVALTTVTIAAFAVAVLAVIFLMPALLMGLNAARVKAKEGVARAMPLETLILSLSREAFGRAQTHLDDLRADLVAFDRQIKKARIDTQLAQAKGNVASALQQANLSAEDQHVTESALSEISRRAGRNAALLDQALASGERTSRPNGGTA
jgi:hypothetical protein